MYVGCGCYEFVVVEWGDLLVCKLEYLDGIGWLLNVGGMCSGEEVDMLGYVGKS